VSPAAVVYVASSAAASAPIAAGAFFGGAAATVAALLGATKLFGFDPARVFGKPSTLRLAPSAEHIPLYAAAK
jgi:hypothetical protein